mmetsp:Transcript_1952/g.3460  ORF Transcript_1952/g.3460 Transcript_1952/m.3460 type:complete len:306 (+) Transcript_1952:163-1080(+)
MSKVIAVFGATGAQGGSVANALLESGKWKVRALTSEESRGAALKAKGAEVVKCSVHDSKDIENALKGAYGAYVVTNFWDPSIMLKEGEILKNIIKIAKEVGVQHLVLATLPDAEKVSGGKYKVEHFTLKANAGDYAKSLGFPYLTFVEASYYYSNWFAFFKPTKEEDGTLVWKVPMKGKISQYDAQEDTGRATAAAFADPEKYNKKYILLEGDFLTPEESVALIGKAIGKKTRTEFVPYEVFAQLGFPGAHELADMGAWFDHYECFGPETAERKRASGKAADPKMKTFEQWLATGAWKKYEADFS